MENNQTAESNIVESVTETPQPVPATMQDFIQKRFINKYVVVRTTNAGVFYGLLKVYENRCAVVEEARRIWRWDGAASLSQLAMEGVKSPEECKIPREVDYVMLEEVIEVIPLREDEKNYIKRQLEKLYGELVGSNNYEDKLVARGISLSLEILNGEVSVDCEENSESL